MKELFQLVDKDGKPTGQATREECHGNPRLIHLVIHLHVFDSEGRLLLQRRALTKDTNPGLLDTSVGGHVKAGEPAEDALLREAREELGIDATGARFMYGFLHGNWLETEYALCYRMTFTGPVTPDPEEISEVHFYAFSEIDAMIGTGSLTPMFEYELPLLKKNLASGST